MSLLARGCPRHLGRLGKLRDAGVAMHLYFRYSSKRITLDQAAPRVSRMHVVAVADNTDPQVSRGRLRTCGAIAEALCLRSYMHWEAFSVAPRRVPAHDAARPSKC